MFVVSVGVVLRMLHKISVIEGNGARIETEQASFNTILTEGQHEREKKRTTMKEVRFLNKIII